MSGEKTKSKQIKTEMQSRLDNNHSFNFKIIQNKKKSTRNGLLLILISIIFGAGVGAIIDLIYLYSNITNEYAIMGIGSGVGAIMGIVIGLILFIALKSKMVDNFSASYGAGIGSNIFVGAIIGTIFGVIIGSLFGLILEVLKYVIDSTLSLPVFAILIWTVLGLNIGALIGVIASFGTIKIVMGGGIAGIICGGIGMLAIFGPDIIIAIGIGVGLIGGLLIGIFVKYGLEASSGNVEYPKFCSSLTSCTEQSGSSFARDPRSDRKKKSTSGCSGANDCDGCGDCFDCLGSGGGGDCEGAGPAFVVVLVAIPVIILLAVLSFVGTRASIKFGGSVKKGSLTALGASFSIFLIIGSNVGLTEAYHNMLFEHNVLIGAGIGLIYGILIFASHSLSLRMSFIEIAPQGLAWKDRHTTASVKFSSIKHFEFIREERTDLKKEGCYEDYFKFTTHGENREKVLINCWATPEGTDPTEHIQTIIQHCLSKNEVRLVVDQPLKEEEIPHVSDITGYSFDLNPNITQEMVDNITHLIERPKSVTISWLVAVTKYEKEIVEEIITMHFGLVIEDGKVLK
ncbi:MAG: hypothetical protein ACTSQX_12040 [Candidatus Heimdallarchaeota archaeon]